MPERGVILLAEDNEDDILLIRHASKKAGILNPLFVVRGGEEAIDYLRGAGKFASRAEYPLPSLLLLDLNMPGKDGYEVLQWIRSQPELRSLRVVALTAESDMDAVNRAYQLGANSFLVKATDLNATIESIRLLKNYWIGADKCPEVTRPPAEQPASHPPPPASR
jgi:CheY-like chemotaxis protein